MKSIATILFGLIISLSVNAQSINVENSSVNFSADYLGFGSVEGAFDSFNGFVQMDKSNLNQSSINFTINANSVNTKSKRRTRFLKGESFFNTDQFQTIEFISDDIFVKNGKYSVAGNLNIKGIISRVEIPFQVIEENGTHVLKGDLTVNRFDFDLGSQYKEWVIGKEVKIDINCVVNSGVMQYANA